MFIVGLVRNALFEIVQVMSIATQLNVRSSRISHHVPSNVKTRLSLFLVFITPFSYIKTNC